MPDLVPFQRGRSLLSPARCDDFFGVLDEFFSPNARSRTWRDTFNWMFGKMRKNSVWTQNYRVTAKRIPAWKLPMTLYGSLSNERKV